MWMVGRFSLALSLDITIYADEIGHAWPSLRLVAAWHGLMAGMVALAAALS
jgi:hypothetical protein